MSRFGKEEEDLVVKVLRSGEISPYFRNSNGGQMVGQLEREFAHYVGADYAVAVSNGTSALHTAYLAVGIKPGDRVVVPAHTFIATASMVLAAGAIPVFSDVDKDTYCMDVKVLPDSMALGMMASAIVPVDLLGYPLDIRSIHELARPKGIKIVDDAAQAVGSFRDGRHAGSQFCDCATWSLQQTKSLTSGEGGMVTTNDPKIADRCRSIRSHGSIYADDPALTFNFRMSELHAAVGLAQLRKYPELLEENRRHAARVLDFLPEGLNPPFAWRVRPNRYILGCIAGPDFDRVRFVRRMTELGASTGMPGSVVSLGYQQPVFRKPLLQPYAPTPGSTPNAEWLSRHWVWIDHRFKTDAETEKFIQLMKEAAE